MASEEEVETPKAPSRLPMIVGMVVAFAIGAGAGFGAATALAATPEEATAAAPAEGDAAPSEPVTRAVHSLGKFTINLRGNGGSRLLRVEVAVEVASTDLPVVEEGTALLRDAVITLASDYSFADIEGLDGKTRLRDELLTRVNALLPEAHVDRVYFTEFVVQ